MQVASHRDKKWFVSGKPWSASEVPHWQDRSVVAH